MKHLVSVLLLFNTVIMFSQKTIDLYRHEIPNSKNVESIERVKYRGENQTNRAYFDTSVPTITILKPDNPNGKSIVIFPGGGYVKTTFDKEGIWPAKVLLKEGYTCFVVKYRIPNPSYIINPSIAPLQDAQEAIRHVRSHAKEYEVLPDKIGVMGFSAGGHVAASLSTLFDFNIDVTKPGSISARPDFTILIYPVISFEENLAHNGSKSKLLGETPSSEKIIKWSMHTNVNENTPPTFLVHASDDISVPVGNSLAYYKACIEYGVSAEMHLYSGGGHGFGIHNKTTDDNWMDRLINWLNTIAN